MVKKDVVKYWRKSAEIDFDAATDLFKSNKYHHCLFFCHLSLEKTIKAIVIIKNNTSPFPIHNLIRLSKQAKIVLTKDQTAQLREINTFNLRTRYDDYKLTFFKKATKKYTQKWYRITRQFILWLTNNYLK